MVLVWQANRKLKSSGSHLNVIFFGMKGSQIVISFHMSYFNGEKLHCKFTAVGFVFW